MELFMKKSSRLKAANYFHKSSILDIWLGPECFTDYTLHKKWSFSIKDFSSKCDQIRSFLQIWSHLLEKSLMENFVFCAVTLQEAAAMYTFSSQTNWTILQNASKFNQFCYVKWLNPLSTNPTKWPNTLN